MPSAVRQVQQIVHGSRRHTNFFEAAAVQLTARDDFQLHDAVHPGPQMHQHSGALNGCKVQPGRSRSPYTSRG